MRNPGFGSIALLIALLGMLGGVIFIVYQAWLRTSDAPLPGHFVVAMTLGIVLSLIVGIGLMALVFYSSRRGHDEPPSFEKEDERSN
jgi:hypothetical protein